MCIVPLLAQGISPSLSSSVSHLSSVRSLPRSLGLSIFPLFRCSRFPLSSTSYPLLLLARAYARARAPTDFFPVFTHRSFFPFRNIIGGAMHLSPFPSPPSDPLTRPLLQARIVGSPRSLTRSASPTSAKSWTRAGNSLTRSCRRQEALIVRYLGLTA